MISGEAGVASEQLLDDVVSDAERTGLDETTGADDEPAQRRPPHPMDREPVKGILRCVHQAGRDDRQQTAENAGQYAEQRDRRVEVHVDRRQSKDRARAQKCTPGHRARGDRPHNRHKAPRPPLEQQELNGEQHRGQRRVERRRHPTGGAGDQQRFALVSGQVQVLREDRSGSASGHDDRSLGTERSARADADRGGDRLQQRDPRLDTALPDEDHLDRLGHPVTADLLRSEPRHQTDDQAAGYRCQ